MKLRIKGNSIRLRLGQSEVRQLAIEGVISEFTDFGNSSPQRFGYALHVAMQDSIVSARFTDGRVIVRVPDAVVRQWAASDQIGIRAVQPTADGGELRILIEKDLKCIETPEGESEEDAFPNPQLACATGGN